MSLSSSPQQPSPPASRWRLVASGILGGATGGLVWGLLHGLGALDVVRALVAGAAAFGSAELASTYLDRKWQRRFGYGLVVGHVGAVVSYLLFAPDKPFLAHAGPIVVGAMVGGFIYVMGRERGGWPKTGPSGSGAE